MSELTSPIPKTFLIGVTQPLWKGIEAYLTATGQMEFLDSCDVYFTEKKKDPLCLVSFYAKLCYKSLVLGQNANVTKIRDIEENLQGCFKQGHGSVFEHVWLNFVTTDCSRVFTHELVRHRVGTAFSQTSGRYVSIDELDLVVPPAMQDDEDEHPCPTCSEKPANERPSCGACKGTGVVTVAGYVEHVRQKIELGCRGLRKLLIKDGMDFDLKKKLTSAIRRVAPNGQTNEIGWSVNVRALRHLIQMRTSRHAEWEIRLVFDQVASLVEDRWPMMLYGGKKEEVDGFNEWTKLHV